MAKLGQEHASAPSVSVKTQKLVFRMVREGATRGEIHSKTGVDPQAVTSLLEHGDIIPATVAAYRCDGCKCNVTLYPCLICSSRGAE